MLSCLSQAKGFRLSGVSCSHIHPGAAGADLTASTGLTRGQARSLHRLTTLMLIRLEFNPPCQAPYQALGSVMQ